MVYTFDQIHAVDPNNPQVVASNGVVTIFSPGDLSLTPVPIFTPDGLPLANPIIVNSQGYGPAFISETLDRVAWTGGGFSGYFTSYEGMKNEAAASRVAAESAAARAEVLAGLVSAPPADIIIQLLSDPQSSVRQLLDATYAAGDNTGSTGGGTLTDVDGDGVFEQGANPVLTDPDDDGIFQIVSA